MASIAEYDVTIGGKKRRVRISQVHSRNAALIELDGKPAEVELLNWQGFDLPSSLRVDGKSHKIVIGQNDRPMIFQVKVDGKEFALRLDPRRRKRPDKVSGAEIAPPRQILARKKTTSRSGAVVSVMPGRVVLLKVKTGDRVKASDPLCILEAMKMENEIVAPRKGTITEIVVEQGAYVNKGDLLFVIEEPLEDG